jgi:hypothetical protein
MFDAIFLLEIAVALGLVGIVIVLVVLLWRR